MSYNKSYHRFFEGYVEKEVWDPRTGKMRIERKYAGDYYSHKMDDEEWKKLKVKYGMIYVWALICLILQGISGSTTQWYLIVPLLFGLIAMVWLGFYVCAYISHKRELTIRQYRDREMLSTGAIAGVIVFCLVFIGQAAWMILVRYIYPYGVVCMIADVTAALALFWMFRTERDMDYVKRKNDISVDADSYDIVYRQEEE